MQESADSFLWTVLAKGVMYALYSYGSVSRDNSTPCILHLHIFHRGDPVSPPSPVRMRAGRYFFTMKQRATSGRNHGTVSSADLKISAALM